jgi:hypothetical protein
VGEADHNAKRIPKVPRRPGKKRRVPAKADTDKQTLIDKGRNSRDPMDKARGIAAILGPKR